MDADHQARHDTVQHLYAAHQPWLQGRLQRHLRNAADAEDMTAETFLQVLSQPRLGHIREPRAFLTTIAKRLLFHFWRRRDLEQAYRDTLARLPEALAPSPEEQAMLQQSLTGIAAALEDLPPKARQAFLYSQIDGLGYDDIAQRLGVTPSTVRHYMAQGFRQCARMLASQADRNLAPPQPPRPGRPRTTAPDRTV